MLAELDTLRTALDRQYRQALAEVFRPQDAAPGAAHDALAALEPPAILTTNYDDLIELADRGRKPYTWRRAADALSDLEIDRRVLLKVHGSADDTDSVVMTLSEYRAAHRDPGYRRVLGHLLQAHTFLFVGYGLNDPEDLDLLLRENASAFRSAARRHFALLRDPADTERDRLHRDFHVQVVAYRDHEQVPAFLQDLALQAAATVN